MPAVELTKAAPEATESRADLKRQLRDANLLVAAYKSRLNALEGRVAQIIDHAHRPIEDEIGSVKFATETLVHRALGPMRAVDAIAEHVTGDRGRIVTLEDLAQFSRAEIAGLGGVGPKAMDKLDVALAKRGLSWAEQEAA